MAVFSPPTVSKACEHLSSRCEWRPCSLILLASVAQGKMQEERMSGDAPGCVSPFFRSSNHDNNSLATPKNSNS